MRSLNFHLFTDRFCVSSQVPRKSGFYEQVTGDMKGGDEDMSIAENFGRKGSAPGVLKRDLQFHADLNRMNRPKEAQAKTRRGRQAVTSCPKYAVVWAGKVGLRETTGPASVEVAANPVFKELQECHFYEKPTTRATGLLSNC
jgi:hypothetical protein